MKYTELKNYKYKLAESYTIKTDLKPKQDIFQPSADKPFIKLSTN